MEAGPFGLGVGTILSAELKPEARNPAYVLLIDFGPLGVKTSSAQITQNFTVEELVGKQVIAVTNFPPKRVAGVRSEVLVLAAVGARGGILLLEPSFGVLAGTRVL